MPTSDRDGACASSRNGLSGLGIGQPARPLIQKRHVIAPVRVGAEPLGMLTTDGNVGEFLPLNHLDMRHDCPGASGQVTKFTHAYPPPTRRAAGLRRGVSAARSWELPTAQQWRVPSCQAGGGTPPPVGVKSTVRPGPPGDHGRLSMHEAYFKVLADVAT